jgi:hypothetical protein
LEEQKDVKTMKDDRAINAKTMKDLIIPGFQLINKFLLSEGFKPEWVKEPELHEVKFTGPDQEACEFSARAETRRKTLKDTKSFPVAVFNFRRGNLRTSNTGHDRADGLKPYMILFLFKNIFVPWCR